MDASPSRAQGRRHPGSKAGKRQSVPICIGIYWTGEPVCRRHEVCPRGGGHGSPCEGLKVEQTQLVIGC